MMTAVVRLGMIATMTLIVPGFDANVPGVDAVAGGGLNATEVEGLVVRESNASTACGPGPAAGRGCSRVAVLLTAGFHDVRYGRGHRFDGRQNVDPGHPLLAAWLRTTSLSLRRHVVEPNRADVFMYSWNPSLADAFGKLYAPVRAAFAGNAPLMRKIKRGALAGCPLVNAVLRCSENAVSWAYTIREAEVLLSGHERARGFVYDVVVFARPDIILFADVDARELVDARTVVMPSPNRGDHFFMMHRRTATVFATAFDVAATEPGCAVGCLDAAGLEAIGRGEEREREIEVLSRKAKAPPFVGGRPVEQAPAPASGERYDASRPPRVQAWKSARAGPVRQAHPDHQLWKSAFLTLRAKATLRPSRNNQPEHVAPYRTFGLACEFQPRNMFPARGKAHWTAREVAAVRAELDAIAIDDRLLDLTIDAHRAAEPGRAFCPWLCSVFPNRTKVKCPMRQPFLLAASCCRHGPNYKAPAPAPRKSNAAQETALDRARKRAAMQRAARNEKPAAGSWLAQQQRAEAVRRRRAKNKQGPSQGE